MITTRILKNKCFFGNGNRLVWRTSICKSFGNKDSRNYFDIYDDLTDLNNNYSILRSFATKKDPKAKINEIIEKTKQKTESAKSSKSKSDAEEELKSAIKTSKKYPTIAFSK